MWGNVHMSRISGIIAFQTKESNLERDLRKETDIKWVTKENLKLSVLKLISRAKLLADCSFDDHWIAKHNPFDTRIWGSTGVTLGLFHVEFQFFIDCGSSHQSLQSGKTGFVERTAMFEIARLQKCRQVFTFAVLQFTLRTISVIWVIFMAWLVIRFYFILFYLRKEGP